MYLCSLPGPACCSCHVYDFKVFLNAFCFFLRFCLPSMSILPLLLIISLLYLYHPLYFILPAFLHCLSPHSCLRLLVRTCVHHQHILATCYLITRARATLKTSLAEETRVKHQSVCYATKANHTTRTIHHGECEELIRSLTEALFT